MKKEQSIEEIKGALNRHYKFFIRGEAYPKESQFKKVLLQDIETVFHQALIQAKAQGEAKGAAEAIKGEEVEDMIAQAHTIGAEVERERIIRKIKDFKFYDWSNEQAIYDQVEEIIQALRNPNTNS